jgi:hypothetical protein
MIKKLFLKQAVIILKDTLRTKFFNLLTPHGAMVDTPTFGQMDQTFGHISISTKLLRGWKN